MHILSYDAVPFALVFLHVAVSPSFLALSIAFQCLDELQERTLQRRAEWLNVLVEVDGGNSALGNAFRGELEFLRISR